MRVLNKPLLHREHKRHFNKSCKVLPANTAKDSREKVSARSNKSNNTTRCIIHTFGNVICCFLCDLFTIGAVFLLIYLLHYIIGRI